MTGLYNDIICQRQEGFLVIHWRQRNTLFTLYTPGNRINSIAISTLLKRHCEVRQYRAVAIQLFCAAIHFFGIASPSARNNY